MNHFYSYILYKGLSEDFAIWRREQKRLSHNLAMKKYRQNLKEDTEETKMWKRIIKKSMTPENIDKLRMLSNIKRNEMIDKIAQKETPIS